MAFALYENKNFEGTDIYMTYSIEKVTTLIGARRYGDRRLSAHRQSLALFS